MFLGLEFLANSKWPFTILTEKIKMLLVVFWVSFTRFLTCEEGMILDFA